LLLEPWRTIPSKQRGSNDATNTCTASGPGPYGSGPFVFGSRSTNRKSQPKNACRGDQWPDCAKFIGRTRLRLKLSSAEHFLATEGPTMRATKWALLASLVCTGIFCNAAKSDVLIKNDGGGDIPQYAARYLALQLSGERVVIDGDCLSACTLALGLLAENQRCFTKDVRLGFHAAWTVSGGAKTRDPFGTAFFWSVYPAKIRYWISRHGGLTEKVIYLEGKKLAAMYPPCRGPIRSRRR
jgi:hypothetical protein